MEILIALRNTYYQTSIHFQLLLVDRCNFYIDLIKGRLLESWLKMLGMAQKNCIYTESQIHKGLLDYNDL